MSNNTIDWDSMDFGAPIFTVEALASGVQMQFCCNKSLLVMLQNQGRDLKVTPLEPPYGAGEAVFYINQGGLTCAVVRMSEAGAMLRVETPDKMFFLAHYEGAVVTHMPPQS